MGNGSSGECSAGDASASHLDADVARIEGEKREEEACGAGHSADFDIPSIREGYPYPAVLPPPSQEER